MAEDYLKDLPSQEELMRNNIGGYFTSDMVNMVQNHPIPDSYVDFHLDENEAREEDIIQNQLSPVGNIS